MSKKFIYVFSSEDCDRLIAAGYQLMNSDKCGSVYVFLNEKTNVNFALDPIGEIENVVFSNTLVF